MYALINLSKVREVRKGRFYEQIPDGRCIVPFSELRAFGTLENVDIIGSSIELKELIERQKQEGITPSNPASPDEDKKPVGGTMPEENLDSGMQGPDGTATDGEMPPIKEEEIPSTGGDLASGEDGTTSTEQTEQTGKEELAKKGGKQ